MKRVKGVLFSNGSELMSWTGRNCEQCWKHSRFVAKTDSYTRFRCSIDLQIQQQVAGLDGSDMVYPKTVEAVSMADCPQREKTQKKYSRGLKGMKNLFENE
jgi:hypothetical protein